MTKSDQGKEDYKKHKSSYIARATKWNKENVEKHRKYDRRWKEKAMKDPIKHAKMLENNHRSYWKDPDKRRAQANAESKRLKDKVFAHYGMQCVCCGERSDLDFLTIDHMNNDGANHRKSLGLLSGTRFYRWLIKEDFPEGFQTLCWNCNCGKRINHGICPHKKEGTSNGTKLS